MKQVIVMIALTLAGTVGVVLVSPFLGVAVYYLFAVLRPQSLWQWSLPPGVTWSYYVALATILAALGRLLSSGHRAFNGAHGAMLLLALWLGVSFVTARDRQVASWSALEYTKIFIMVFTSAILIQNVKHVWVLFVTAALALGYIAYEVNFLYLMNGRLDIYHSGFGGLDNNGAGLMLAMGVPLCYFAWEGCQGKWRWAFLVLIPLLLHAVLMTYSRGAMVSLLAVTPLIWLRSQQRRLLGLGGLALLFVMPLMAGPEIRARFFTTANHEQDGSAQSRFQSWTAAWHIAQDNPIFGVGLRNSNLYSFEYGADLQGRTIHNQYLQIAADAGFVGLGLYLAALGMVWCSLRGARLQASAQNDRAAPRVLALCAGIEASLSVFCVGGMFLSLDVFELPYLLLLLGTQLGTLAGSAASVPEPRRVARTALATAIS